MSKCHKCGVSVHDCKGWLERVNPKGEVPAIWECRPDCNANLIQEQAVLGAIRGPQEPSK